MKNLQELKKDCMTKQKKGLHFIIASVFIWTVVAVIHASALPILTKNLFTFCATAPLLPLAFMISKIIKVDFQNKENPLSNLGLLFSINQMLYLVIAMWVYSAMPDKMLMVIAIIFGAHLLPFAWLYESKSYYLFSIVITISGLMIGLMFTPVILAISMILFEILFCLGLFFEVKRI